MKKITRLTVILFMVLSGLAMAIACSKDEGDSSPGTQSFSDFEFSGIFRGSLYTNGSSSPIEGYVTIASDGSTTLDLLSGRMIGTSVHVGDNYNISITNVYGIFEHVSNISGTIEISTRTLYLSGTNADGSPLTVGGDVPPVQVQTTGGWENMAKSAIFFTHNESCKASITINGVTLSGLNGFYQDGGLCSSYYSMYNTLYSNHDAQVSQVYCHTGTLMGLDGNPLTYTDCNTAAFYLAKNTSYNYTVNWENGEITTGQFTSPGGGGQMSVCISNDGPECNGDGLAGSSGNPRFNLQFTQAVDLDLYVKTPNGTLIYYSNQSGQGGSLDVDCTCSSTIHSENIFWANGTGPTGQYEYYVKYYSSCGTGSAPVSYTVKVMNGSNVAATRTGTLSTGQTSATWTHIQN